jgi:hypothetical protein
MNGRIIYIAHRIHLRQFIPMHAMKKYGEYEAELQTFLTSAVDGPDG